MLLTYMAFHRTGRRDRCFSGRRHDGQLVPRPEKRGMLVVRLYCSVGLIAGLFWWWSGSLTLLVYMMGHVGDGAWSGGLWAPVTSI